MQSVWKHRFREETQSRREISNVIAEAGGIDKLTFIQPCIPPSQVNKVTKTACVACGRCYGCRPRAKPRTTSKENNGTAVRKIGGPAAAVVRKKKKCHGNAADGNVIIVQRPWAIASPSPGDIAEASSSMAESNEQAVRLVSTVFFRSDPKKRKAKNRSFIQIITFTIHIIHFV